MPSKDPRIDAYIAQAAPFAQPILKHLRKIVHAGCPDVIETIKWRMPFFEHFGVMCSMAAFKNHCAFGFWKTARVVEPGESSDEAMGQLGRITSLADLPPEKKLLDYVRRAAQLNASGTKAPERAPSKKRAPLEVPDYFAAALKKNAKARRTFENFSPTNQREYVDWLTEAKREATRTQRLQTALEWLAEGKTRMWKYQATKR